MKMGKTQEPCKKCRRVECFGIGCQPEKQDAEFTCKICRHVLPASYQGSDHDTCYMCDSDIDYEEDEFDTCASCDQPDACSDFCECAIKVGLRNDPELCSN